MNGMIERAAKAILAKVPPDYGMTEAEAAGYARAAIEAMREPTEAMADAGGAAFLDGVIGHESGDKANRPFFRFFRAMLDEALTPSPSPSPAVETK